VLIDAPIAVTFIERDEPEESEDEDDQDDVISFQHGVIDVGLSIRDEILINVPMSPICQPDCAGICPICGANRNATPCACEKQPLETSKLGGLAKIKLQ
jgi:uncharacterized protein